MNHRWLWAIFAGWVALLVSGCAHARLGYYRFNTEVTTVSSKDAIEAIHAAERNHASVLIIDINSPGGSVWSGFEVAKAIENAKVKIVCVADGEAASMAFYLLQSCPVRYMTKRSMLMTHNPSIAIDNDRVTPTELAKLMSTLATLANAMAEHCASRLHMSVDAYKNKIDGRDWNMNWQEALAVGAVDHVVDSVRQVALLYR